MSNSQPGAATETVTAPVTDAEQQETLPDGPAPRPKNDIDQISDLLAGGSPPPEDTPADDSVPTPDGGDTTDPTPGEDPIPAAPGEGDEPHTTATLAKELGVTKRQLFDTQIPIGADGESLPLSEVKELAVKYRASEAEREAFEDQRTSTENKLMRQNNELQGYINELLPHITPELSQRLQQREAKHIEGQYGQLYETLPDLAKPENMAVFQSDMLEHFEPYGIGKVMIANIKDASVLKYVHDNIKMAKQLAALKANKPVIKDVPKGGRSQPKGAIKQADIINRGKSGGRADKLNAITQLLRG